MTRKWLSVLGIVLLAASSAAQQRWLTPGEAALSTDGVWREHALPTPKSGPTTIALAPDGTVWFTEGSGNRIGRMNPDGTGMTRLTYVPVFDSLPAWSPDGTKMVLSMQNNYQGPPEDFALVIPVPVSAGGPDAGRLAGLANAVMSTSNPHAFLFLTDAADSIIQALSPNRWQSGRRIARDPLDSRNRM